MLIPSIAFARSYSIKVIEAKEIRNAALLGPTNVYLDEVAEELYVGRGDNLYILNMDGILLAKFCLGKGLTLRKIVLDSQGIIYGLDWGKSIVKRYDFLGKDLGEFKLKGLGKDGSTPVSLTVDRNDNLYILDGRNGYCYKADGDGNIIEKIGDGRLKGYIDVDVSRDGKEIVFLNFSRGKVCIYKDGRFFKEFGKLTGSRGGFSQPVAISIGPDRNIYVLDRNRGVILVFDESGRFLGEFGEGLFYFPNDIFVDSKGRIFVADTVNRRLEMMRVKLKPLDDHLKNILPAKLMLDSSPPFRSAGREQNELNEIKEGASTNAADRMAEEDIY